MLLAKNASKSAGLRKGAARVFALLASMFVLIGLVSAPAMAGANPLPIASISEPNGPTDPVVTAANPTNTPQVINWTITGSNSGTGAITLNPAPHGPGTERPVQWTVKNVRFGSTLTVYNNGRKLDSYTNTTDPGPTQPPQPTTKTVGLTGLVTPPANETLTGATLQLSGVTSATAPATVAVNTSAGAHLTAALAGVSNGVATYNVALSSGSPVATAAAVVSSTWAGTFQVTAYQGVPLPPSTKIIWAKLGASVPGGSVSTGAEFVITQLADASHAPADIIVVTDKGSYDVPLTSVTGHTAHYILTFRNEGEIIKSASTRIYSEWSGEFNLSHYNCIFVEPSPTPVPSETATPTPTPTPTESEKPKSTQTATPTPSESSVPTPTQTSTPVPSATNVAPLASSQSSSPAAVAGVSSSDTPVVNQTGVAIHAGTGVGDSADSSPSYRWVGLGVLFGLLALLVRPRKQAAHK